MTSVDPAALILDSESGILPGDKGPLVKLYQANVGQPMTGVWSVEDEAAYITYSTKQNWQLIHEVIDSWAPSFWDVGVYDKELELDLTL
jgi:hypothetical protein